MAKERVPRGVRKVNETITQEGRALILTEAEADKLLWDDIPVGSIRINEKNGTWSVKIEGETGWVPGGIKNDGTLNVMKDTRIGIENFIIKQLEVPGSKREFTYYYDVADEDHIRHGIILYKNKVGMHGEYGQYGTFPTWAECKRRLLLEDDMQEMNYRNTQKVGYVFGLEKGDYAMYRNHLKVFIDDILTRTVASGGIKEVSETRFCLTEENLENDMEITAEYIHAFRLGNPYPRTFINKNEPDEKAAEVGDFWLDIDGKVNDTDPLPDLIDEDGMVGWDRIRPTTRPTSLAGYGITDKVSYQGHKHQKSDIVDFPTSLPANGGRADVATRADKADTATTADSAKTATTATKATTADRALKADTASKATTADSATSATTAGSANYATRAGSADKAAQADKATTANTATKANSATSAQTADYATKAGTATSAANATKAASADKAANADYATKAGTATSATSANKATTADTATKAVNDGSGRNIVNTYATKEDINSATTRLNGNEFVKNGTTANAITLKYETENGKNVVAPYVNGVKIPISTKNIFDVATGITGWAQFGPILMQWGFHEGGTLTFPKPFPNSCDSLITTRYASETLTWNGVGIMHIKSLSKTGATFHGASNDNDGGVGYSAEASGKHYWLAIGH